MFWLDIRVVYELFHRHMCLHHIPYLLLKSVWDKAYALKEAPQVSLLEAVMLPSVPMSQMEELTSVDRTVVSW